MPLLHSLIKINRRLIHVRREVVLAEFAFPVRVSVHRGQHGEAFLGPHARVERAALMPEGNPRQELMVRDALLRFLDGPTADTV